MREITIPISEETIRSLHVGEPVEMSGVMITGRDAVHKWMSETFIKKTREPRGDDLQVYEEISRPGRSLSLWPCSFRDRYEAV